MIFAVTCVCWSLWKEGDDMKREAISGWKYTFVFEKAVKLLMSPC